MLKMSQHPHIKSEDTTQNIMFDVLIALLPCLFAGVYFFGYRALVILAISIVSCLTFEYLWCKLVVKKPSTTKDLSAVVTASILTMNLPITVPLWLPVIGSFFAIVIVKCAFGGLGQNFMNPAAASRIFLAASFAPFMTKFVNPEDKIGLLLPKNLDALTSATPLAMLNNNLPLPTLSNMYFGGIGGCIGETSVFAIMLGCLYLIWRKVIKLEIPLAYLGTAAIIAFFAKSDVLFQLCAGGLMFGAVFMATDYATAPLKRSGRIIYGILLGLLTMTIRFVGSAPEGVCMSILVANLLVPLIDKLPSRRFGSRSGGQPQ